MNPAPWPQAPAQPPSWQPPAAALAALGEAGRGFLTSMLVEFSFDLVTGTLLLEAAKTLDDLEVWRATAAIDKTAARMTNLYSRTFAALLAQIGRV